MQVFAVQHSRSRQPRRVNDQGIPERNLRETVEFDGRDDIASFQAKDSGTRQDMRGQVRPSNFLARGIALTC